LELTWLHETFLFEHGQYGGALRLGGLVVGVRSQNGRCFRHTGKGCEVAFGLLHLGLVQGNHSTSVNAIQLG
jgi:hypothetical protein